MPPLTAYFQKRQTLIWLGDCRKVICGLTKKYQSSPRPSPHNLHAEGREDNWKRNKNKRHLVSKEKERKLKYMMTIVILFDSLLKHPLNEKCLTVTVQVLTGDRTQNQKSSPNC